MRPEGWNNPYPTDRAPYVEECVNKGAIFEAGADAYEEALRKEPFPIGHLANAIFLNNLSYDSKLIEYEGKKGCLAFIEDDE